MNSEEEEVPNAEWRVCSKDAEPDLEECVPLSVRNAR